MIRTLVGVEDRIARVERLAVFAALMGLVITLFLQVIFRFVIEQPLDFTEEVSRTLLIWLVFLGAAYGTYTAQHFVVDFIFTACPQAFQRIVGPLVDLLTVLFLAVVLWVGWNSSMNATVQQLPVLGVPVVVQVIAMPIGAALMILHTLMALLRRWAGLPVAEPGFHSAAPVPPTPGSSGSSDRQEP